MASPKIIRFRSRNFTVDEFSQTVVDGVVEAVEQRVENAVSLMQDSLEELIYNLDSNTASPRMPGGRRPPMRDVYVHRTAETIQIGAGRYRGRFIKKATLSVRSFDNGLDNALNAMDTGIREREVYGKKYMRFPRYEGNIVGRSGSLAAEAFQKVRTGEARVNVERNRHGTITNNWVTVRAVAPSAPFNFFKRLRRTVRQRIKRLETTIYGNDALGLSKIEIKISGILGD